MFKKICALVCVLMLCATPSFGIVGTVGNFGNFGTFGFGGFNVFGSANPNGITVNRTVVRTPIFSRNVNVVRNVDVVRNVNVRNVKVVRNVNVVRNVDVVRNVNVVRNVDIVQPVTVVRNVAVTSYAEVPNLQLQRIETVETPCNTAVAVDNGYNASAVDSCNNAAVVVNHVSAFAPRRVVVERLVDVVPTRVVERRVVVQRNVQQVNVVKVVKVQRNRRVAVRNRSVKVVVR